MTKIIVIFAYCSHLRDWGGSKDKYNKNNNMNATISMDGLWAIVDSLSKKNKKWLSDKLIDSLAASDKSKEDEILGGIVQSMKEAKKGKTQPLDTLWEQL